jgi:endonuclease YncB( thermonuclease family)
MSKIVILVLAFMLALQSISIGYAVSSGEIDAIAIATSVHDGDTFSIDKEFHGSHTIRLADVNASELGQPLSVEARNFLSGLVYQKTVYLDIDDVYIFDYSGTGDRLVCVVYVSYNSTHYENVNKALLDAGLAEKKDYNNEFDPNAWTLYASKEAIPEFQPLLVLPVLSILTFPVIMIYRRKRRETEQIASAPALDALLSSFATMSQTVYLMVSACYGQVQWIMYE